eukprot:GGOE01014354.1.p1 GENE.GGOE01014354.1~~GGOE01014354.1.p1  ORF type:complete len:820 (+),score=159.58 GGOE01014354.1:310-2460(+)
MAPPQILNNSEDWQLGFEDDHLERPSAELLLPPASFTAPTSTGAEWIAIPNLLHNNPSLYRSVGLKGESMWFVIFGTLHSDIPHNADPDAALWALVSEHQSTVVRDIEQLTFATTSDEDHAVSACTLQLRTGAWDCGTDLTELVAEDPPPCLAVDCSHAVLVVGDAMEWMDTQGASLRFVVGDHVWAMQVDTSEAGSTVLFQMQSSPLLPALASPKPLLPPPSSTDWMDTASSMFTSDWDGAPPRVSYSGPHFTILRMKWCAKTASSIAFIMVVLFVMKRALRLAFQRHPCITQTLPVSRDPLPQNVVKEPNAGMWCMSGRVLGRGAYGVVIQALDPMTGQIVAVKQLAISKATEVEREVKLLSILKHPNIVSYLGSFTSNNSLHLVMEYVPCGSLESLMQTYKFIALPALRMYAMDILHGLSYLHGHGIIHRDIKPANILIGQDGMCKLADFGLSRAPCEDVNIYRSLTATDMARTIPMGTPAYMSPEAIQGTPCMASDVWAVGMTLMELSSGQKPWNHLKVTQPMALLVAIVRESEMGYRIPKWMPHSVSTFLRRCLVSDANRRATAEQLLCDIWIVQPNPAEAQIFPDWFVQQGPQGVSSGMSPQATEAPTISTSDSASDWFNSSTTMSQTISLRPEKSSLSEPPRNSLPTTSSYATLCLPTPPSPELTTSSKKPNLADRSGCSPPGHKCSKKRSSSLPAVKKVCPLMAAAHH